MENTNPNHSENLVQLNRILGQVSGIKKMIDQKQYCPNIINQINAVRGSLKTVANRILEKHLRNCVQIGMDSSNSKKLQDEKIKEILDIIKKSK